jgi:hypothetical protein
VECKIYNVAAIWRFSIVFNQIVATSALWLKGCEIWSGEDNRNCSYVKRCKSSVTNIVDTDLAVGYVYRVDVVSIAECSFTCWLGSNRSTGTRVRSSALPGPVGKCGRNDPFKGPSFSEISWTYRFPNILRICKFTIYLGSSRWVFSVMPALLNVT